MKKLCFLICTLSLSLAMLAQNKQAKVQDSRVASPNAPVASSIMIGEESLFFVDDTYDFGNIPQGKPVTHTFLFINKGKTPLTLTNVNASCGCTTPVWSKEAVAPGDTGKIVVGYNSAAEGPFDKPVSIVYNNNLSREIHVKGNVWKTPASAAPENEFVKKINQQK